MIMSTIRIIVADDQPLMRAAIRQSLETADDIEVLGEAADGVGAVDLARRLDPDVLVVEAALPNLDGLEVARRIRSTRPAISVLVLTAHEGSECALALLGAGAGGYLLKTVSPQTLIHAVRLVRSGGTVLDPVICGAMIQRCASPGADRAADAMKTARDRLTARETTVLRLAATGMRNKVIAVRLGIGARTVKGHMSSILAKLQVGSRTEAVHQAIKLGYISMGVEDGAAWCSGDKA